MVLESILGEHFSKISETTFEIQIQNPKLKNTSIYINIPLYLNYPSQVRFLF